jgi:hypothetical protein
MRLHEKMYPETGTIKLLKILIDNTCLYMCYVGRRVFQLTVGIPILWQQNVLLFPQTCSFIPMKGASQVKRKEASLIL